MCKKSNQEVQRIQLRKRRRKEENAYKEERDF